MITSPESNTYFRHETSGLNVADLDEAFSERYWWALRFSDRMARIENMPSTEFIVKELNSRLLLPGDIDDIRIKSGQVAGEYRTGNVRVTTATVAFPSHKFIPNIMASFGSNMDNRIIELDRKKDNGTFTVEDIIENTAFAMYWLVRIHPFAEGNGRTSREFAQILLKRYDLPLVFVAPVNRGEYIKAIMEVDKRTGDIFKFRGKLDPLSKFIARHIVSQARGLGTSEKIVDACNAYLNKVNEDL